MTDIPDDVMKAAREALGAQGLASQLVVYLDNIVARAILADRAAQAEHMARMEEALRDFERNATAWMKLPRAGVPAWLERCVESARTLSQEGSDA